MVTTCQIGPVALKALYRDGFCVDKGKSTNIKIQEVQDYTFAFAEEIPLMALAVSTMLLGLGRLAVPKGC